MPSIENLIDNEIKNETDNITFLCQAVGVPVPYIRWCFNGKRINAYKSDKYLIMSRSLNTTTNETTLTVYNLTSFDVGTYTCSSSNRIGSVISSGILTVTSKISYNINIYVHVHLCT